MENHHFLWENQLLMAIFNSYVKLPEGNTISHIQMVSTNNMPNMVLFFRSETSTFEAL
jgi:hypothetical protein